MSDNPYKGIPGGDPKFRTEHLKTLVLIAYICPSCNQEKSEKFPEGKDLTGRICIDCRNTESARKSLEHKEQVERDAQAAAKPVLTVLSALMKRSWRSSKSGTMLLVSAAVLVEGTSS